MASHTGSGRVDAARRGMVIAAASFAMPVGATRAFAADGPIASDDRTSAARASAPASADANAGARADALAGTGAGTGGEPPRLVVLPLDFLDDHQNPDPAVIAAQVRRLAAAHRELEDELQARGLYRVVDLAPAQPLVDDALATQSFLYRCPDCATRIGQRLGAELVMAAWVQKVSELILNFNVEVHRVAPERSVLSKSVDMRGNQDASWERAVRYLVRDMAERRAGDPRYGT